MFLLRKAGDAHTAEALKFMSEHDLYKTGLHIYRDSVRKNSPCMQCILIQVSIV